MLRPKVTTLPGHIQAVYVQNMVKLYASILHLKEQAGEKEEAQEITQMMIDRLPQFVQSADLEVQERVMSLSTSFLDQKDFSIDISGALCCKFLPPVFSLLLLRLPASCSL